MLSRRSWSPICLNCRLRLLAQHSHSSTTTRPSRFVSALRSSTEQEPVIRHAFSRRHFHNAVRLSTDVRSESVRGDETPAIPPLETFEPTPAENEAFARDARQRFGDTLPEGYLSEKETVVYERLYGKAILRSADWRDNIDEEEEIVGRIERDGEQFLLRHNESGELEEVEYVEESTGESEDGFEGTDAPENGSDSTQDMYNFGTKEGLQELEELEAMRRTEQPSDPLRPSVDYSRTHPLTEAGRMRTWPSTVRMPYALLEPSTTILSQSKKAHLTSKAHELFGGHNLPLSVATPKRIPQHQIHQPVAMDAAQSMMSNIEADVFLASMVPGLHASSMAILVEVRKRLGSSWIEQLVRKEGGPVVLDAGAGGAGIMAWKEILQAEWSRLREEYNDLAAMGETPPGKQTVVTGSDTLRHRISPILDNTQFIPRLPETIFPGAKAGPVPRKLYDVIIAPHHLLGIREPHVRKQHVQRLWSLLNPDGGVLILLEKGLPRGFEVIGAARQMLLDRHILNPASSSAPDIGPDLDSTDIKDWKQDTGMIVAPCTNHTTCPMYKEEGEMKGRKDFCYFSQRFTRPPYLQRIVGGQHQNHEDIQFSYLAVRRGIDFRNPSHDPYQDGGLAQGKPATDDAFDGFESLGTSPLTSGKPGDDVVVLDAQSDYSSTEGEIEENATPISADDRKASRAPPAINTMSLPRIILPPLKRRGHVILDMCTPAGTLDRWTVPASFSKQAYRDARKASWGDLWALGAKTRVAKNVRTGTPKTGFGHADVRGRGKQAKRGGDKDGRGKKNVFDIGPEGVRLEGHHGEGALGRKATRKEKRKVRMVEKELREAQEGERLEKEFDDTMRSLGGGF